MINITNKKKSIVILIAIVVSLAMVGFFFIKKDTASKEGDLVREREYVASIGDITVGIDGSGVIKLKREEQTFKEVAVFGKYYVKVGDAVKKGDILAELSMKDLEDKQSEIKDRLKEAQNVLSKAKSDKELFEVEADKKVKDIRGNSEAVYNSKTSEIKGLIDNLNNKISSIEDKIVTLKQEKEKLESEAQNENNTTRIDKINEEISAYQEESNKLKSDLDIEKSALSGLETERDREVAKENEDIELLKRQNESQIKSLQGALESAQNSFDKINKELEEVNSLIASPKLEATLDGVVLSTPYLPGETISTAKPVVEIGDMTKPALTLFVDSIDVIDISEGQEVSFYVDAYPEDTFTGKVESRSYVQDENKKLEVRVTVDENDAELLEGMGASATIIIKQKKDILTLSNKAIKLKDNKQFVKVRNAEGKVEEREITTGFSDGRISEILSGLNDKDVVISEG
ncbi:efflux RND transporter periplasmic adaptor subunit [Clostridium sp. NSJ-6]|uniref:Efflux RND transporter periplasmic adaptor subunit n=1 Tax=Clostridium hominis TaxID=2763036 RepID=A0ABR7DD70_9CLOT|nr:efflux RND transporter periplasmic adaptor subunit [Clostridium hominis]MBC5628803.1 efflux RND transporter periplasmic adaptor subunit [Clostridium hominis]